jgi:hypothetical protein
LRRDEANRWLALEIGHSQILTRDHFFRLTGQN